MTISTGNSYLDSLAAPTASTTSSSGTSNQTIDQDGFLKLLTAQMTMQDPTAPTDNNQMVQQMATFSQVAGTTQMNQTLTSMASDISASRFGSASSWVGHAALVTSDVAAAASNGAYAGEITLPSDASDVQLTLVDASGNVVHSSDLGAHSAGAVDWSWDGKDDSGTAVAGPVQMITTAYDSTGAAVAATNSAWTEIASVQSPVSGSTKLITALGSFAPTDIQAVS